MRPCGAQAGRMLLLRETTSCSPAVTVKVEPPLRTDGWTSSTCCLGGKKSRTALPTKERSCLFFPVLGRRRKTMPWGVSMCSLLIYVLNSRRKSWFWGVHLLLGGVEVRFAVISVSISGLCGVEEHHGRTGKGGAPAAPSVPVPRPVARGLADRRQVRMQPLLASFTHGALKPLRICAPWEHHIILSIKYLFCFCIFFLSCDLVDSGGWMCLWSILLSASRAALLLWMLQQVPLCARRRLLLMLLIQYHPTNSNTLIKPYERKTLQRESETNPFRNIYFFMSWKWRILCIWKNVFEGIHQEGNENASSVQCVTLFMLSWCHKSWDLQWTACHLDRRFQVAALSYWQLTFAYSPFAGQKIWHVIRYALLNLAISLCCLMENLNLNFMLGVSCC